MHQPVLLQETLQALNIVQNGLYIDATFGAGGHAKEIVERGGKVLALDADNWTVKKYKETALLSNIKLVCGNYEKIYEIAKNNNWVPCQGILFDLGLSMDQIGETERGFSYKKEHDLLDMRLDDTIDRNASDIIKNYSEQELYATLVRGAEELYTRTIVQSIVRTRRITPITHVFELNNVIQTATGLRGERLEKIYRRVYQALYIEVNDEFEALKRGLEGAYTCLEENGRIVIICFHSGHDRIIKQFKREHTVKMIVIKPKFGSIARFERSATIRILIKNNENTTT